MHDPSPPHTVLIPTHCSHRASRVPPPQAITTAHADMGLEVHGLLVASTVSEAMRKLCTDVHVFRSWTAVPGGNDYMYT